MEIDKTEVSFSSSLLIEKSIKPLDHAIPTPETEELYKPMLQGTATNQFTQLSPQKPEINHITKNATIENGSLKVYIEKFDKLKNGLRLSTNKLLNTCMLELTAQNEYRGKSQTNPFISIDLKEYLSLKGYDLKPRKTSTEEEEAKEKKRIKSLVDKGRREVKADLETLYSISLEWSEPHGKDYTKTRICDSQGIKKGQIIFNFSAPIAEYLTNAYIMQFPIPLLGLDERNPLPYYLGTKLFLHRSIDNNFKSGTHNIISVKALLNACTSLPTYEEVMETDRAIDRRVVTPFTNALDVLQDELKIITYEYCNSKKKPLTDEQLSKMDYETFIDLYIHFEATRYPDQTKRLERKTQRSEATKKKRAASKKKTENN